MIPALLLTWIPRLPRMLPWIVIIALALWLALSQWQMGHLKESLGQIPELQRAAQENAEAVDRLQAEARRVDQEMAKLLEQSENNRNLLGTVLKETGNARNTNRDGPVAPVVLDALRRLYPNSGDGAQDRGPQPPHPRGHADVRSSSHPPG